MRVAYPMRVDALDKPGGDLHLMRIYIAHCEDAARANGSSFHGEVLVDLEPDLSSFDVVHLTNLDRPVDLYAQFRAAKLARKPIVITPLHHSFREIERYERYGRGGTLGRISGWMSFDTLESMRTLVKSLRYPQLRTALWRALRAGLRKANAEVLEGCKWVLVAAQKEADDISSEIALLPQSKTVMLRNGFAPPSTTNLPEPERDIDIIVVSRVEARKNQIAILKAVEQLGLKATFVGAPNPNHAGYVAAFRDAIGKSKSTYIPGLPRTEIPALYARSRVHVAASWFEVSSLVDIDAYVAGCRVVASVCGGTRELLGDDAYYIDPGSVNDIAEKISQAVASVRSGTVNRVSQVTSHLQSWEEIGRMLLGLYNDCVRPSAPATSPDRTG